MRKYITPLIFENLFVVCLTNCSITPSSKEKKSNLADSELARPAPKLASSKTVSPNPSWLGKLMKAAREIGKDEEVSLFPAWMKDDYIQATKPKTKKKVKISSAYDVRGDSGITESQLNSIFKGVMSGKGAAVIKEGRENGIDPAFLAAILLNFHRQQTKLV